MAQELHHFWSKWNGGFGYYIYEYAYASKTPLEKFGTIDPLEEEEIAIYGNFKKCGLMEH